MSLKRNMTCDEMVNFINNELLPQAKLEIQTWIWPKKKPGGYFVVARQIFCMVDFLGATFSGYHIKERKADKDGMKIASSNKAKKFITTFFEPKQTYHSDVVDKLYDMYRNGLVHLYQPKILKLDNKSRLQWGLYRGDRHQDKLSFGSNKGNIVFYNVNHLQIIPNKPKERNYYLVICIDSLYEDFEKAIQKYRDKLATTKVLQRNWRTTINAIIKPR
jgi:hypothetical protein